MTTDPLTLLAAVLVGTLATARCARLVTSDNWPPIRWLRLKWLTFTGQKQSTEVWGDLMTCPFCFAPYAAAGNIAWALLAGLDWYADGLSAQVWWVVNVWAAVSYLAAMIVVRDEPED